MKKIILALGIVTLGLAAYRVASPPVAQVGPEASAPTPVSAVAADVALADQDLPTVKVFKSQYCGCCGEWVKHLESEGFTVEVVNTEELTAVKTALGVGPHLASCHTAEVGDYLVEGHVPASDIKRMLAEKPDARGLAVPGMPVGSPGMEVPGQPADRYDVLLFKADGSTSVFQSH
jgi:hypothetical protein